MILVSLKIYLLPFHYSYKILGILTSIRVNLKLKIKFLYSLKNLIGNTFNHKMTVISNLFKTQS